MDNLFGGNKLLFVDEILAKAEIKEAYKIADLGCGAHGFFIYKPALIVGNNGLVYAVDVVKKILESHDKTIKSENYKNIKTVWTNLENYKACKIDSMTLDLAFLVNVLHQSDRKIDILRESIRLLKKGAKLIIVDWTEGASLIGPDKEKKINKDNLITALKRLGMSLEEEFVAGKFHYGLILKKL